MGRVCPRCKRVVSDTEFAREIVNGSGGDCYCMFEADKNGYFNQIVTSTKRQKPKYLLKGRFQR